MCNKCANYIARGRGIRPGPVAAVNQIRIMVIGRPAAVLGPIGPMGHMKVYVLKRPAVWVIHIFIICLSIYIYIYIQKIAVHLHLVPRLASLLSLPVPDIGAAPMSGASSGRQAAGCLRLPQLQCSHYAEGLRP